MTNASFWDIARRCLIAWAFIPAQAGAQLLSSVDLSSRSARPAGAPWHNHVTLSPSARFDAARFSIDGRWTALRTDAGDLTGNGALAATYYSPVRGGLQLSMTGFADRSLLNETVAVSRAGADARLSYRHGATGIWFGREASVDNKATAVSAVPRVSGGAWRQWGRALFTVSLASYASREGRRDRTATGVPNPTGPFPGSDTLTNPFPVDTPVVSDTGSNGRLRSWNDAEMALDWGIGRLAFRGVIGTRFFAEHQPNELWGQVQSTYTLGPDVALIAATGVHPSAAAYGVSRARFLEIGVRLAPSALLRPRVPRGVRPTAAAFEVSNAVGGQRTLRIRVPNARTVELSGDFTGWKPIALTRAGVDQWEARVPLAPGIHRLVIRVDGDAWTPPPGVNAVPDEFQGTVGVIVVRD
ncbi:MAG TPA: glycogen-binding domain-containing protein [Gemmatimonadaceae bacterium]|jgi:hypothetical protein|nr:glycogen-binding domain-containing protein [Gemmatimonadaceae bacterium]